MKRIIAAILAADVAGFSRLVAEDEEETLRRLVVYRGVFGECIERFGGRIFNTAGDAILAEFPSAVEAVRCALEVQEALRAQNLSYPPNRHMAFRIGITIGDVVERDGDLLGDGVNVAARLEGLSPPGGLCVSRSVHDAVANKLTVKFTDRGLQRLKNIPEPVHAFVLAAPTGGAPEVLPKTEAEIEAVGDRRWALAAVVAALACAAGVYFLYNPASDDVVAGDPIIIASPGDAAPPVPDPPAADPPAPEPAAASSGDGAVETAVEAEAEPPEETGASARVEDAGPPATVDVAASEPAGAAPSASPDPAPVAPPAVTPATGTAATGALQSAGQMLDTTAMMKILPERLAECKEGPLERALAACQVVIDNKFYLAAEFSDVQMKYGRALRKAGRKDEAIKAFTVVIDKEPTSYAYNLRGITHHEKSDWKNAIADFNEAVRLSPRDGESINNRAWTYYKGGDLDSALKDADEAVKLIPNRAYAWDTRGHINAALGNRTAAIADFRKALSINGALQSSKDALKDLEATP